MREHRGFREAVCQQCGAAWSAREARFCGHCGARLRASAQASGEDGSVGTRPPTRRLVALAAAVLVLTVVAVAAVTGETAWLEPGTPNGTGTDVDLPAPEEIEGPDGPNEPAGMPQAPDRDRSIRCEPPGCELWRVELTGGTVTTAAGRLLLVLGAALATGTPGAQDDDERPGLDVTLTAVSTIDGEILWQEDRSLPRPDPEAPHIGLQLTVVDDELVLAAVGSSVLAVDLGSGAMLWSARFDHSILQAGRVVGDDLLTWGETFPDEQGTDPTGIVSRLDGATGEPLWSREGALVATLAGDQAIVVDRERESVAALDVGTGDRVWDRSTAGALSPSPATTAVGGVVVVTPSGVEVIDPSTGRTESSLDAEYPEHGTIYIIKDLLVVHWPVARHTAGAGPRIYDLSDPDGEPRRIDDVVDHAAWREPRTAELHDVSDPDAEPRRIDDVVDVVPLHGRSDTPGPAWETPETPAAVGLGILVQDGDRLRLAVLEPDGSERWSVELEAGGDTCCWRLQPGQDETRMVLVPPDPIEAPSTILSTDDGTPVGNIPVHEVVDDAERVMWFGEIAVAFGVDRAEDTVLVGPEGHVRVQRSGFPITFSPVPVFAAGGELVGIDPTLLLGELGLQGD